MILFAIFITTITCFIFIALYFFALSFLPMTDSKLAKIINQVRRKATGSNVAGGMNSADFGRYVSEAASRAKMAIRYQAKGGAFGFLKRILARMVVLSEERRAAVNRKLCRAGYKVSAELFYADVIARVFAVALIAPVFFVLGIPAAAAGTVLLCVGLYYKWIGEPDERLRRLASEIVDELPRFVSVLSYSMKTDRDLVRTIERYLKIAKPALRSDLELLLLEMKAGNYTEALRRFDERVGNAQLSAFISGLIDAGRGVDQKTFFFLMEENMKQLFIENRKKELARRPARVKKAIIATGLCMFLIYLVPICVQLIEGMTMFR